MASLSPYVYSPLTTTLHNKHHGPIHTFVYKSSWQ